MIRHDNLSINQFIEVLTHLETQFPNLNATAIKKTQDSIKFIIYSYIDMNEKTLRIICSIFKIFVHKFIAIRPILLIN